MAYEFSYEHIENIYQRYKTDSYTTYNHYEDTRGSSRKSLSDKELVDVSTESGEMPGDTYIPEKEIEI